MPHNFIGLDRQHNNFRKGIYMDPYDEPTFLTFALDFKFDEIPSEGNPTSDEALYNSPLFSEGNNGAMSFLRSRGYDSHANQISLLKSILLYLTFNAPWYFQSIDGLHDLYEGATDMSKSLKVGKNNVLTVNTLEAVDLRMSEIAGLYRNAILDKKYKRERVPDNLRWFSMDIYLAEFRNLRFRIPGSGQTVANTLGINTAALGSILGGGNVVSNVMEQFGYMKFSCRQCEFDFSESLPVPKTIEVGGSGRKAESNKFKIKVGWMEEEVKYGDGTTIYEDNIKSSIKDPWGSRNLGTSAQNVGNFLTGLPIIGDSIQSAGQKAMSTLSKVGGLVNPALEAASDFLNSPVTQLGEVNSFGYATNEDVVPTWRKPPSGKANQ